MAAVELMQRAIDLKKTSKEDATEMLSKIGRIKINKSNQIS